MRDGRDVLQLDLRGYRWWRVGLRGTLRSPWNGPQRWERGVNTASCHASRTIGDRLARRPVHDDPVPSAACRCGFYALHQIPTGHRWPGLMWDLTIESSGGPHRFIFGVVQASGSVLLGRSGWRAERACVIALYADEDAVVDLRTIGDRYGVPVYHALDALTGEWGPSGEADELLRSA